MKSQKSLASSDASILVVECAGLKLHSTFQPIISVVHSKVVGHEALIRAYDEDDELLQPAALFPRLKESLSPRQMNEECARLHLNSFSAQDGTGWLFLNFNPDAMPDRSIVVVEFGQWLNQAGLNAHQVVIEIVETQAFDEEHLAEAVAGFRDLGCLVAIDDFGAGASNFERVWRFRPDIVKLDRAMIQEAAVDPLVRRILPGLVSLVHEAGALVVMEGIETERQAMIAVESNVDFVQGFYFCAPSTYGAEQQIRRRLAQLTKQIRSVRDERVASDRGFFSSFTGSLEACVSALEEGRGFHDACAMFLALTGVQRVYELDEEGYQVGRNAESPNRVEPDARFAPCADGEGANWFRRAYFQRAIARPGQVQISYPYLSIRDAASCVTMSLAYERENIVRVLCADLDHERPDEEFESHERDSGIVLL